MANCKLVHENIFAYAEKELPPALMHQLDQHVSECADCSRVVAEFGSVLTLMEEHKSIEPRPFAETRILQGIESRLVERQRSIMPLFSRVLQPALISIGVTAALAIGFVAGSGFADTHSQYSQNSEVIESVRSDLNVPEFMNDDLFIFTE